MADKNQTFVTGWPITHSRSPLIHNHWLEKHGLSGSYDRLAVKPEEFQRHIDTLPGSHFIGGNVTIPHKETAYDCVDHKEPVAERLQAVNTVWVEQGQVWGTNTDGYGFLANLDDQVPGWDKTSARKKAALVLGAGGASRAIIDALIQRGFEEIIIANRTLGRAVALAEHFGSKCRAIEIEKVSSATTNPSIIINTTAVGMNDDDQPVQLDGFSSDTVVNDIVYTPLWTPLLKQAKLLGMKPVDGLGMLLHQAVPGFEKWYGIRPEVTQELRDILLRDLGELS